MHGNKHKARSTSPAYLPRMRGHLNRLPWPHLPTEAEAQRGLSQGKKLSVRVKFACEIAHPVPASTEQSSALYPPALIGLSRIIAQRLRDRLQARCPQATGGPVER